MRTRRRSTSLRRALRQSLRSSTTERSRPMLRHSLRARTGLRRRHTPPASSRTATAAATNFRTVFYGTGTIHSTTEGLPGSISLRHDHGCSPDDGCHQRRQTNAPAGPALVTLTNTGMINVGGQRVGGQRPGRSGDRRDHHHAGLRFGRRRRRRPGCWRHGGDPDRRQQRHDRRRGERLCVRRNGGHRVGERPGHRPERHGSADARDGLCDARLRDRTCATAVAPRRCLRSATATRP